MTYNRKPASKPETISPAFNVLTVRDGKEEGKGHWTQIGVAFAAREAEGFNIVLDALPLDGRLFLRLPKTGS